MLIMIIYRQTRKIKEVLLEGFFPRESWFKLQHLQSTWLSQTCQSGWEDQPVKWLLWTLAKWPGV